MVARAIRVAQALMGRWQLCALISAVEKCFVHSQKQPFPSRSEPDVNRARDYRLRLFAVRPLFVVPDEQNHGEANDGTDNQTEHAGALS
jgi:hypothetical protein